MPMDLKPPAARKGPASLDLTGFQLGVAAALVVAVLIAVLAGGAY